MLRDLQSCSLDREWRALTHDRSEWRNRVRIGTSNLNQQKEADEKHRKDEQKCHHEARQTTSVLALHCDEVGSGFTALTQPKPVLSTTRDRSKAHLRQASASSVARLSAEKTSTTTSDSAITAPNFQHSYNDPGLYHSSWNESSKRKRCVCVCVRVCAYQCFLLWL